MEPRNLTALVLLGWIRVRGGGTGKLFLVVCSGGTGFIEGVEIWGGCSNTTPRRLRFSRQKCRIVDTRHTGRTARQAQPRSPGSLLTRVGNPSPFLR